MIFYSLKKIIFCSPNGTRTTYLSGQNRTSLPLDYGRIFVLGDGFKPPFSDAKSDVLSLDDPKILHTKKTPTAKLSGF